MKEIPNKMTKYKSFGFISPNSSTVDYVKGVKFLRNSEKLANTLQMGHSEAITVSSLILASRGS